MPIEVIFKCSGCDAEEKGTEWISNEFHSFNGKGYGFGIRRETSVQDATPPNWIAFDPWTQCTYCPDCWQSILSGID